MTRNTKYILIIAPVILAAPLLTLLFKSYGEEIAFTAFLITIITLFFFLLGMPKEERKLKLKRRLIYGSIAALFSIGLLIYEYYHPQFLFKMFSK